MVVVLPSTVDQVSAVLRYCRENDVKVVPRGAGTGLSGGALPLADGVLLGMAKFNKVLEIDYPNRCAVVQPGVTNLGITNAVTVPRRPAGTASSSISALSVVFRDLYGSFAPRK